MVKYFALIFALLITGFITCAQQPPNVDSLKRVIATAKEDTNKILLLFRLTDAYNVYNKPDTILIICQEALRLANKLHHPEMIVDSKGGIADASWILGDYLQADKYYMQVLKYYESRHMPHVGLYAAAASNKRDKGDYHQALNYIFKGDSLDNTYDTCKLCGVFKTLAGSVYVEMNMPDSALYYLKQGPQWDYALWLIGCAYEQKGNKQLALVYYHQSFLGLTKGYNLRPCKCLYKLVSIF